MKLTASSLGSQMRDMTLLELLDYRDDITVKKKGATFTPLSLTANSSGY